MVQALRDLPRQRLCPVMWFEDGKKPDAVQATSGEEGRAGERRAGWLGVVVGGEVSGRGVQPYSADAPGLWGFHSKPVGSRNPEMGWGGSGCSPPSPHQTAQEGAEFRFHLATP